MEKHRWHEWLLGYRCTGAIQVIYAVYLYGEYSLTKSWWWGNSPWTLAVHRPDSYQCPTSLHPHAADVGHHCTRMAAGVPGHYSLKKTHVLPQHNPSPPPH